MLVDIHCHILPGVDDGAPDMETSRAMIRDAYEQGVRYIIATPHYRPEMFEPSGYTMNFAIMLKKLELD